MANADIEHSIIVAIAHFCDKSTPTFGPTNNGFRRWLNVYYGIKAARVKINSRWTWVVSEITDPEKAVMFKLRF